MKTKRLILFDISGSVTYGSSSSLNRAYEALLDTHAQNPTDELTLHAFSAASHVKLLDPTHLLTGLVPGYGNGEAQLDRVLFYFFGPESMRPDAITVITDNGVLIGDFECPVPVEVKLLLDSDTEPVNPDLLNFVLRSGGSITRI